MSNQSNDQQMIYLKNVRLSFPQLFEKKAAVANGKEKYGCNIIIDPNTPQGKENLRKVRAAIKFSELEKFQKSPMAYKSADRQCLLEGDDDCFINSKTKERYQGYEGMMILRMGSDTQPQVVDRDPSIALDKDDPIPYAGCWVDVLGRIFSVDGKDKGGAGTFCGLNIVQFRKHGDAFGGAHVDATKVMDTIDDDDDAPAGGGGDDDDCDDLL
jgi:hypothetical protein